MDWNSLWIGAAGSLVAALIVSVIAWAKGWVRFAWFEYSKERNLSRRMFGAGVSNFYSNRDDFERYRGATRLIDYISLAERSIHIASHWLAHGAEMEGIVLRLAELVKAPRSLTIVVGVIDPNADYIRSFAVYLDMEAEELRIRSQAVLNKLWQVRESLAPEEKPRFQIKVYHTLPIASVIILDARTLKGRLQIDLKSYRISRRDSFAIEFSGSGRPVYERLAESWIKLLEESRDFSPSL